MTSDDFPLCPECNTALVPSIIMVDGLQYKVWICDCMNKGEPEIPIQEAREHEKVLVIDLDEAEGCDENCTVCIFNPVCNKLIKPYLN